MAEKYFGNEDPVGKIINIDNKYDFKITGIIENCPENTHIKYNFLASFISLEKIQSNSDQFYRWGNNFHDTYLRLQNFAYRINIGLGIFLTSGVIVLVIALLTVSYQSIKGATANPVDSLRYE